MYKTVHQKVSKILLQCQKRDKKEKEKTNHSSVSMIHGLKTNQQAFVSNMTIHTFFSNSDMYHEL